VRAEGTTALVVAAFGVSLLVGMQAGGGHAQPPASAEQQRTGGPRVVLAEADPLPGLATSPTPKATPEPRAARKPRHRAAKPAASVPVTAPRPAPARQVAAAPVATPVPAPRAIATPRPKPAPAPTRAPSPTSTPAPSFDDNGQPNSGSFDDGGG
jgi:hypothetical protein